MYQKIGGGDRAIKLLLTETSAKKALYLTACVQVRVVSTWVQGTTSAQTFGRDHLIFRMYDLCQIKLHIQVNSNSSALSAFLVFPHFVHVIMIGQMSNFSLVS